MSKSRNTVQCPACERDVVFPVRQVVMTVHIKCPHCRILLETTLLGASQRPEVKRAVACFLEQA